MASSSQRLNGTSDGTLYKSLESLASALESRVTFLFRGVKSEVPDVLSTVTGHLEKGGTLDSRVFRDILYSSAIVLLIY